MKAAMEEEGAMEAMEGAEASDNMEVLVQPPQSLQPLQPCMQPMLDVNLPKHRGPAGVVEKILESYRQQWAQGLTPKGPTDDDDTQVCDNHHFVSV